jgi:membrane glycosyltransferase
MELHPPAGITAALTTLVAQRKRLRSVMMPPLNRTTMAPRSWQRRRTRVEGGSDTAPLVPPARGLWHRTAALRRAGLFSLVLAQTWLATNFMASVLPYHGREPLEIAILILFAILFGWVSAGFWTAMTGFIMLWSGGDHYAISESAARDAPIAEGARCAIIMPIFNENVARVFAGLRATYESLASTGNLHHFDFFVLSDSNDPDTCAAEPHAWLQLCRSVNGFDRIYYRRRRHRIKRKSGNIADFCRRWGKNYRYMVVLDADSIMTGDCLTRLVRLMEANPGAGIIQTVPTATGRETLHARAQQFAGRVYGPLFSAGLHFWQLGESHYWGHNAIIRVAPFIGHCALKRLSGRGSLSGEILSHDSVEAALMRRAGWGVWLAYDLPGSYEELPPNLIDEVKRDRRWCQGNLMNFRLFLMKGLHPAHRAVFVTGVMAYLSAALWFLFLVLSTALLAMHTLVEPEYFVTPFQLFPLWPEWRPARAIALFGTTATLLFVPKLGGVLLACRSGARTFGGGLKIVVSALAELALSALLAPIRMLFHTQFVAAALAGWPIRWNSPPREDAETTWQGASRRHVWHTLLGVLWAGGVYWLNPEYLWWMLPIVGAFMLSIPLSVYMSRISLGRRAKRAGIFLTPEEIQPPREIQRAQEFLNATRILPDFATAVTDPVVNALACASGTVHAQQTAKLRTGRMRQMQSVLAHGPQVLTAPQKLSLLGDAVLLSQLHAQIGDRSSTAHAAWRHAGRIV